MKLKQVKMAKPLEWLGSKQVFRAADGYRLEHLHDQGVISIEYGDRAFLVDQTGAEMEHEAPWLQGANGSDQPSAPGSAAAGGKRKRKG